ncbi:TonB-dependent receptor [Sphingomonas solaris]|nr:TonB-dependent receptor [Sphingomonas solaris]
MRSTKLDRRGFSQRVKLAAMASAGLTLCAATPVFAQAVAVDPTPEAQTGNEIQPASPRTPQAQAQSDGIEDIVVTARRDAENAQRVPVSVQVVTGSNLQKLAITSVEEVSKLAPGLTLVNAGSSTSVTLRGVTWQPGSGTPATPIYFNDVPFDPGNTIVSLFDVGQIEVLRGPQGTTRGAPSISGAVTITTRKPDLEEFGGYVQGLYGSGDHYDVQGAINAPIIKGVLALRLATNIEGMNGTRITSVNSSIDPTFRDRTYRATALFKPTDTFSLQAMYQRRKTFTRDFTQVVGSGSPGLAALGIPANYNGPALTFEDRKSVQDQPTYRPQHVDLLTVNANWEVLGHNISANYGRQFNRSPTVFNAVDPVNIVPGYEPFTTPGFDRGIPKFETREVRISSIPNPDRPFDYDLGWFSKHSQGVTTFGLVNFTPGAFGAPFQARPGQVTTPNPNYVVTTQLDSDIGQRFDSFYGNVRFHIDDDTELSGGLSILRDRVPVTTTINSSGARVAFPRFLPAAAGGCPSPLLPNSADYGALYCQVNVPAASRAPQVNNDKFSKALYNFSLSHQFTDDILVYGTTGTSFRSGLPSVGNAGLPFALQTPAPETATSYEVGVKTTISRALRVNAAIFQLDYKNQLTTLEGVRYFSSIAGANVQAANVSFYGNLDARVRGAELEIVARPFDRASLGANLSYSKIKSQGGIIPCNTATAPTAAVPVQLCTSPSGQVLNTQAPFQATVNGGYEIPFSDAIGGYFRFNVNYQGKNPNFGNFRSNTGTFRKTPSYAIVDLFAGLTGTDSVWDLGVYAKNVFDKDVELARIDTINTVYPLFAAPDGYDVVRANRPREIGVTMRYAFGSR